MYYIDVISGNLCYICIYMREAKEIALKRSITHITYC